jgi:hypothetical protein
MTTFYKWVTSPLLAKVAQFRAQMCGVRTSVEGQPVRQLAA